jgi:hypothetical protein
MIHAQIVKSSQTNVTTMLISLLPGSRECPANRFQRNVDLRCRHKLDMLTLLATSREHSPANCSAYKRVKWSTYRLNSTMKIRSITAQSQQLLITCILSG